MVVTVVHGENVLFLNLFKDEESSEILDSNLESDLISTYSFDEDNESIVFKNNSLNNTEPGLIEVTKLQPEDLEGEQVSSTLKEAANLQTSQVPEEKTEIHSKHTTNENSQLNTLSKATVEDGSSISKKLNTVLPERSEELDSFVKFCFDIIAYFIHGVMSGITSVGDTSTNSKPTGVTTDYSQSPSRKRKRDLKTEIEPVHSAEPNKDKSVETNVNQVNKEKSVVADLNIDSGTSLAQHEDSATSQDETANSVSKQSTESSATLETHKILNEPKTSITDTDNDSIVSYHLGILKNSNQEQNDNSALLNNKTKKDVTELKKNVIEVIREDLSHTDRTSIPKSPLLEENIGTHTNKEDHDLVPPLESTEEEISNSFLLNDFINKQVTSILECHILAVFIRDESHCRNLVPHQHQTTGSI